MAARPSGCDPTRPSLDHPRYLNELEYADGRLYANVWQTDFIAIIDPATGEVTGWIDLGGLNPDLRYNLANFMRTLALPEEVEHWPLTTLRGKLVKIGARIVRHGRYLVFQLAEVAVPRSLFASILERIDVLRPKPAATPGVRIGSD
jgi:hypothetical protein